MACLCRVPRPSVLACSTPCGQCVLLGHWESLEACPSAPRSSVQGGRVSSPGCCHLLLGQWLMRLACWPPRALVWLGALGRFLGRQELLRLSQHCLGTGGSCPACSHGAGVCGVSAQGSGRLELPCFPGCATMARPDTPIGHPSQGKCPSVDKQREVAIATHWHCVTLSCCVPHTATVMLSCCVQFPKGTFLVRVILAPHLPSSSVHSPCCSDGTAASQE